MKSVSKTTLSFVMVMLLCLATACQDELPQSAEIEKGKETVSFAIDGGSTAVKIKTNASWKAASSQSWLTVTPASGGSGTHTLTLTAAANTTDGQRTATVSIQVGYKTSTINVTQAQRDVLGLETSTATVAWTSGTYELKFSSNVGGFEFTTNSDWLQPAGTKALTEKTLILNYGENPGYEARTGKITISKGALSTTFTLTQGGQGALYFVLDGDEVSAETTGYDLKLMKNTPLNGLHLIDAAEWLHMPDQTRAMPVEETISLALDVNTTSTPRSARLVIRDESTGVLITDTFTLTQKGLENMIRPDFTTYEAPAEGVEFELPVTASGPFDVLLPADVEWLTGSEGVQMPGTLHFTVAPNTKTQPRTTTIILRLQEGVVTDPENPQPPVEATITVTQAAAEISDIDRIPKLFNLLEMATVVETDPVNLGAFRATVVYDAGEPTGWVSDIYANNGKLHFKVGDNSTLEKRSAKIVLSFDSGEATEVRVNQSGTGEAYIEMKESGTLASFIDFGHKGSYKQITLVAEKGLNGDDYNTLRNATLAIESMDLSEVELLTSLPDEVFAGHTTLKMIALPATLQTIGARAFAGSRIEQIVFDGTPALKEIGVSAFEGCSGLQTIPLSASLLTIGERAFARAFTGNTLTHADLSAATVLRSIPAGAFDGCNTLTKLTLPQSVTEIGEGAFRECYNLSGELKLPSALATIGDEAFYNNKNLQGVLVFPSALTKIGKRAFMKCALLEGLTLTAVQKLKTIDTEAFKESMSATAAGYVLTLPAGLTTVGEGAFEDVGAVAVDLPATLAEIKQRAFYNCRNLTTVSCRAVTPPALSATATADTFGGAANTPARTLKVPTASVKTYTDSPLWKLAVPASGGNVTWTVTSL